MSNDASVGCPGCGTAASPGVRICPNCGMTMTVGRRKTIFSVQGNKADEVAAVSERIQAAAAASRAADRSQSPWLSGSFYLLAAVVALVLCVVAAKTLSLWAVPLVIIGAALLVAVIGAMQLRHDDRLSERGFLRLMQDVFRRLPLLMRKGDGT